jgi:hypothetical protein
MVAPNDLVEVQREFAAALLDPDMPIPSGLRGPTGASPRQRFAVYRNNVIVSLVSGLSARFPAVRRLVGDEFFRAMARVYVIDHPPRSPVLLVYGDTFPDFVANFAPAASIEYLADIARLELARGRAYHAADAVPIDRAAFASLRPHELADLRIDLHPSVGLVESRFPVVSIWKAHRESEITPVAAWRAEAALVARPVLDVEVWRLPPGGYAFLTGLAEDMTLAEAVNAASATGGFDAAENLAALLRANVVIGLRRESAAFRRPAGGSR